MPNRSVSLTLAEPDRLVLEANVELRPIILASVEQDLTGRYGSSGASPVEAAREIDMLGARGSHVPEIRERETERPLLRQLGTEGWLTASVSVPHFVYTAEST